MGYSITFPCKSKELQQKMLEFMEKNYKSPDKIFDQQYSASSDPTSEFSYDKGKCKIGFNYSCMGEPESHYVYCVLYWMCLKVGKCKQFKEIKASVPYIIYDGYETWMRLLDTEWKDKVPEDLKWCLVDKYGFKEMPTHGIMHKTCLSLSLDMSLEKHNEKVRKELIRLDELWESIE